MTMRRSWPRRSPTPMHNPSTPDNWQKWRVSSVKMLRQRLGMTQAEFAERVPPADHPLRAGSNTVVRLTRPHAQCWRLSVSPRSDAMLAKNGLHSMESAVPYPACRNISNPAAPGPSGGIRRHPRDHVMVVADEGHAELLLDAIDCAQTGTRLQRAPKIFRYGHGCVKALSDDLICHVILRLALSL